VFAPTTNTVHLAVAASCDNGDVGFVFPVLLVTALGMLRIASFISVVNFHRFRTARAGALFTSAIVNTDQRES